MEQGKLRKDDLQLDSDSDLEGYDEWHGIDSDAEVDLSESEGDDEEDGESEDEDDESGVDEEESDDGGDDGEVDLEESDDEQVAEDDVSGDSDDDEESEAPAEVKEIVETPTPAPAAPAGRYIPPHLRAAQLGEKAAADGAKVAERMKLERKAQGLLNK